jgi:hypothetical protein
MGDRHVSSAHTPWLPLWVPLALAWSRYLRAEQLDTYLAEPQGQGWVDYRASPAGAREHYLLIDCISPLIRRNAVRLKPSERHCL